VVAPTTFLASEMVIEPRRKIQVSHWTQISQAVVPAASVYCEHAGTSEIHLMA
jgi:hypothetical protein